MPSETLNWEDCLHVTSITDIGMRRSNNQDAHVIMMAEDDETWRSRGHLFVVADGMGAHAAGELASKLAAEGVAHHYYQFQDFSPPEAILRAVRHTNEEIHKRGQANSEFHNMGTTCSCLLLLPQGAILAHVGDSRVYRLRNQQLEQLTFDHSLVWEMRAAGQIKDSAAAKGIPKNVITRSLGPNADVQVDLEGPFPIRSDDSYLICSDGLTARIEEVEFGTILASLPPADAAGFLIDLANLRGGPDNCTIVIVSTKNGVVVTGKERVEPLVVGADLKPHQTVSPIFWGVISGALVLAAGLFAANQKIAALVAFAIGLIAAAFAAFQKFADSGTNGVLLTGGKRLGRGPYSQTSCQPNNEVVVDLIESINVQMNERLISNQEIDAPRVKACLEEAEQNAKSGEFADALELCGVATKILLGK